MGEMTTDNRTNEPTPEQVEAAAKAIADCHNPGMFEKYPENWRVEARAALVAAAPIQQPVLALIERVRRVEAELDAVVAAAKAQALEEFADQVTTGFNKKTLNAERRAIKREARARAAEYRKAVQ